MASKKVSLKLLIDSKENRVLFAEAGKHVVDFLFKLLSLPIATVIRLLTKQGMVGCLGNLYQSIENISDTYVPNHVTSVPLLLPNINPTSTRPIIFYSCNFSCLGCNFSCLGYVAYYRNASCPQCGRLTMIREMKLVESPVNYGTSSSTEEGFVKGVETYMMMDDLMVTPMSTISSITLLNKFNVKEVRTLQEKVVDLGMDKGVKLLRVSLQSKNVLTDVFIEKKKKKRKI